MNDHGHLEHPSPAEHFGGSEDFDLAAVERALGEVTDDDRDGRFADALSTLASWLSEPLTSRNFAHMPGLKRSAMAGRRVAILQWVLRPESFSGVTLEKVAAEIGVTPERLHELSAEFSRRFGVRNRLQVSRAASVAARQKPAAP